MTDTAVTPVIDLLATKYRTKREFLKSFTGLHMVVVTLRCNQRCNYCHASGQPTDQQRWDMTPETAINVVHKIMASPSEIIKIEFQGGEPLLNFEVVKTIVREAKKLNRKKNKHIYFVLCSNLTLIDDPTLAYCKKEGVTLSTSLDGPREIHDRHRIMRTGEGSYDRFIQNLHFSRSILGHDAVNPLMTASQESLSHFTEIIDEYAALGFQGIFLRHVNPYGYAKSDEHQQSFAYDMEEFVEAYKKALLYIIELNLAGTPLVEGFACHPVEPHPDAILHRLRRPAIPHRRGDQRGRLRLQRRCLSVGRSQNAGQDGRPPVLSGQCKPGLLSGYLHFSSAPRANRGFLR